MENSEALLQGSGEREKAAYLGAVASLATADREASDDEIDYLTALCEATGITAEQTEAVITAARQTDTSYLKECLDIVKESDLKFSLVTDLISFAKTDNNYSEEEQHSVEQIAQYLGVDQKQFSLLGDVANQAASTGATPQQAAEPDFLSKLGLKDKLESAGINGGSLMKGLLAVAAPLILSKMMSGGNRRRSGGLGGMFGGSGGGLMGGGGLGSLIGMLNGGRGMGGIGGGLLGSLFGGKSRF